MTRINCGIPVENLCNKHLLAEHREIKRIPNAIKNNRLTNKNIPENFSLGQGHVKFFYDKQLYLKNRYEQIYSECIKRNFNVSYYGNSWVGIPLQLMNDYIPNEIDKQIINNRLAERLKQMKNHGPSKNT